MQSNDAPAQNSDSEEISHKNCRKNFTATFLQSSRIPLQHQKDIAMDTTPQKNPRTLLSSIEEIVRLAKEHGVEDKFHEEAEKPLKYLSKVLLMSKEEALVLSLFLELSPKWRIKISDLSEMLKISNIRILSLMNVADELVMKGYIKKYDRNEDIFYVVPADVIDCLRSNTIYMPKPITNLTFDEFFERLDKIMEEEDVGFWRRYDSVVKLVEANPHLPYCKILSSLDWDDHEVMLFHIFAHRLINEDDDIIGTHDWEDIIGSKRVVKRILKSFKRGDSPLIKNNFLEPAIEDGMRQPDYYHFTDKAKEELFPEMDLLDKYTEKKDKSLIPYTSFAEKRLFYAPHIQSQIDRLAQLLKQEQFNQVIQRLSENGMRKGFACLFYGSPGTGKTETVNQLARATGRDVMMVDVTQIKSCWVGESEQNIKALFDRYRKHVKDMEVAPILLFNEADAVLGIRQEGAQRSVDKMENSIQNIILQEMETLEGIMIATTNLTSNLDKAFERRFIYKIEFERPVIEAKQQIWKSMIPALSDEAACSLARDFDLSGGQIENIARKRTVELILSGNEPTEQQIREYCQSETMDSRAEKRRRIGF